MGVRGRSRPAARVAVDPPRPGRRRPGRAGRRAAAPARPSPMATAWSATDRCAVGSRSRIRARSWPASSEPGRRWTSPGSVSTSPPPTRWPVWSSIMASGSSSRSAGGWCRGTRTTERARPGSSMPGPRRSSNPRPSGPPSPSGGSSSRPPPSTSGIALTAGVTRSPSNATTVTRWRWPGCGPSGETPRPGSGSTPARS